MEKEIIETNEEKVELINDEIDNNLEKNSKNKNGEATIKETKNIQTIEKITRKENLFILSLIFLSAFIVLSIYWIRITTGNLTLEQLIFHLLVPVKGTNMGMIWDYARWTFLRVLGITTIAGIIIFLFEKIVKLRKKTIKKILYTFSKITLLASIITVLFMVNAFAFVKNQITASSLIEKEYVDPEKANITFPEQKQNLIYIYLESLENTYTSTENGGIYNEDRMPELTQLAKENISFSNTDKLGGALDLKGSNWTIAAMVSHTAGVPLKITIGDNDYGNHSTFLPGSYSLGEILEKNGYKNYLLLGSVADFGGRKAYFESHGNYEIWDFDVAKAQGRITEEEEVWWGYSDSNLFKFAKEQLTKIAQNDEPFNYTFLTADTHFTDGYYCEKCDNHFDDQYSNVIRCSSKQVQEFVNWIKEQPFYENTTIVIAGDHLTMQASIEEETKEANYGERTIYNAFINAKVETIKENTINREFFTIDLYPTTLAALGVKIEGNKLALGTNLFSEEPTIAEKYGLEHVREELMKKSNFYNNKLIYDK